jgi:hypothetical protein
MSRRSTKQRRAARRRNARIAWRAALEALRPVVTAQIAREVMRPNVLLEMARRGRAS